MSRFVGVVMEFIVGKKSAEDNIESLKGRLSGLGQAMSLLRKTAALVGAALAAAFGITAIVEAFRARVENNRRALDELTSSAKQFAQETTSAFRSPALDEYSKRVEDVTRRSAAAIEEMRAKTEAELLNPRKALLRQFGFGPSREEILQQVDASTRQVEQAAVVARRKIQEQEAADKRKKAKKERDDLYKTVGAEIRANREAQLEGVDQIAFREQEELRKTSELRIRLGEIGERALADSYERAIRDKYDRERKEYQKTQDDKRRKDEEDAARLAETLADAMKKANAEARKDFVESMRAVTQELAQQFENSTAAFRGIVEQQARTASRGVWREV